MNLQDVEVVLASASPRRRELLSQVDVKYIVDPSNILEIIDHTDPEKVVTRLSSDKAMDIGKKYSDNTLIIGADTVVASGNKILGKPADQSEAFSMLSELRDNWHSVFTGVTLIYKHNGLQTVKSFVVETKVKVYAMSDDEILAYIKTGEPMDKAGAYGIQGRFAQYIEGIQGDYNNVVGLPVSRLLYEVKYL